MRQPMMTHTAPQFTPHQLLDAGRRAEAERRPDLAVQFYGYLVEHFSEALEAAEAHDALERIGAQARVAATAVQARPQRRRQAPAPDRYASGRMVARILHTLGWALTLAGPAALAAYALLHAEAFSRAALLPVAGGVTGGLILGLGVILAAHIARAQFDQASAAHELVAMERARLGLD
jgi:hypothetical protein